MPVQPPAGAPDPATRSHHLPHDLPHERRFDEDRDRMSRRPETMGPSLELVELELALEARDAAQDGFCETVRAAVADLDGEFLFDLPASGLAPNCQRIAVARVPAGRGPILAFVLLSADGATIAVEGPEAASEGLVRFAGAFVDVLERF